MSDFYNKYPYTDFHELNLDYILEQMKQLRKAFEDFVSINTITFADPILWSITKDYGKNEVVLDSSGNAYLSLQIIPAGIPLTNTEYWMEIFNFTGFITAIDSNITFNIESNTDIATADYAVNDWLLIDNVLYKVTAAISIGDAFEIGTNIERFTLEQFIKAWINTCTQLINQYKNDIDASEVQYRNQLAQDIADTTASLQAQLDAAISGATVDSEVINARIGANGITYPTLGDAIRTQIGNINASYIDLVQAFTETNDLTIDLSQVKIDRYGYYYNTSGYHADASWYTIAIPTPVDDPVIMQFANVPGSGVIATLNRLDDSTNYNTLSRLPNETYYSKNSILYISCNSTLAGTTLTMKKYGNSIEYPRLYYGKGKLNPGVCLSNGTITYLDTSGSCIQKIPVNDMILHHDTSSYTINAAAFDSDDTYLGAVSKIGGRILTYPYGTAYILFTIHASEPDVIYYDMSTTELKEKYFTTCNVDKPINLYNSNVLIAGDSISLGYWSGVSHPTESYLYLLANGEGAYNINNRSIGGATYSTVSGADAIIDELGSVTLNAYDIIFISAGTNDYGRQQSLTQVASDLNNISDYITANGKATVKVVIITPTERLAAPDGPGPSLDDFRTLITEWALSKEYSVIDGKQLGISGVNPPYMATVTADDLHPNALGHKIMYHAMKTWLL